eukprot:CAMPEP_0116903624 /NCGR_PEP_ID=MMETSP0467-20121206/10858_1 /TAXON_ID=283647 /ORGANISM="Mesodinium pulex, Strain SPMC105" /LENGTH=55 /DNA_ID=CAMNT_0004577961 /DNA_START=888 /DNA_END=1058 /DNA_ORIENTATION=-
MCEIEQKEFCSLMKGKEFWNFDFKRRLNWVKSLEDLNKLLNAHRNKLDFVKEFFK